jgi:5-methylcytosine-specific restriction endonuclease McrA
MNDKPISAGLRFQRRHRAVGLCTLCSEPVVAGQALCQRHAAENCARAKAGRKRAREAGLCANHCKRSRTCGVFCELCWWKNLSYRHFGNRKHVGELRALYEAQGGRCALTGELLRPGVNLSLDHTVPKTRGGSLEIGNCRLVTDDVNLAKQALLDEEFVALCQRVVEHQARAGKATHLRSVP